MPEERRSVRSAAVQDRFRKSRTAKNAPLAVTSFDMVKGPYQAESLRTPAKRQHRIAGASEPFAILIAE
jgi:hypothetical protein